MKKIYLKLKEKIIFVVMCSFIFSCNRWSEAFISFADLKSQRAGQQRAKVTFFDSENNIIKKNISPSQDYKSFTDFPKHLIKTFVFAEDRDFFSHKGIDPHAILRAFWANIASKKYKQGASTITQQLARFLFLSPEKTFTRKIKEIILALRLEWKFNKKEILELYLNNIFLGRGAYGVSAAAKRYFDTPVKELNLGQVALLAAIIKAPSRLAPHRNYKAAIREQRLLLKKMWTQGRLSDEDFFYWRQKPLKILPNYPQSKQSSYVFDFINKELKEKLNKHHKKLRSIKVVSSLNTKLQETLDNKFLSYFSKTGLQAPDKDRLEGAYVVAEHRSGDILALAGGKNYDVSQFNRAQKTQRNIGRFIFIDYIFRKLSQGHSLNDFTIVDRGDKKKHMLYELLLPNTKNYEYLLRQIASEEKNPFINYDMSVISLSSWLAPMFGEDDNVSLHLIKRITAKNSQIIYESRQKKPTHNTLKANSFILSHTLSQKYPCRNNRVVDMLSPSFCLVSVADRHSNGWFVGLKKGLLVVFWVGSEYGSIAIGKDTVSIQEQLLHAGESLLEIVVKSASNNIKKSFTTLPKLVFKRLFPNKKSSPVVALKVAG
jgi:membrane peptidoglycan carboxypeptidase